MTIGGKKKHSKYSPSGAHRWVNCPASIKLCEGLESKSSKYAAEGTDAHEVCEYFLKNDYKDPRSYVGQKVAGFILKRVS